MTATTGSPRPHVFIVGCPRSGTTLLQAMVASHPDVYSLPETHFFRKVFGRLWRRRRWGVVSPRAARSVLLETAAAVGATDPDMPPSWWPFLDRYARTFVSLLDRARDRAGARVWLEKSPIHVRTIDMIERHVPSAAFLHIVRDGREVVTSIYELCERDPRHWIGQLFLDDPRRRHLARDDTVLVERIVERWNRDLACTGAVAERPNHFVVRYDALVEAPESVLADVCAFLGIRRDDSLARDFRDAASQVIGWRKDFQHMRGAMAPLERRASRFATTIPPHLQQRVQDGLVAGGDVRGLFPG